MIAEVFHDTSYAIVPSWAIVVGCLWFITAGALMLSPSVGRKTKPN